MTFRFDNSYARLPAGFFARVNPTPVAAPRLIRLNAPLARQLGLDVAGLAGAQGAAIFSGTVVPAGAEPLAQAYAGHQFGGFSPQLGDGRAILLGEVIDQDAIRRDIQLKGAGPTPFSRRGDGRAALGPVLREYLVSEAMAALGIPTTRALAAVTTGESVWRETAQPGAVLTRIAASHLRVGTFQYFAARAETESVRILADYAIARHCPPAAQAPNPYLALLDHVVSRQAELIAHWLLVGFIHGVMNTDNTSISGETIDFGPCAFMDAYNPGQVFSSIDHGGRYAYANQPRIAQWNLARLAETMLPLFADSEDAAIEAAQEVLARFAPVFQSAYAAGLRRKLGLLDHQPDYEALVRDFLTLLAEQQGDFTRSFRALADGADAVRAELADPAAYGPWAERWAARLAQEGATPASRAVLLRAANPAFIPRNHWIAAAIDAAVEHDDFSLFHRMVDVLAHPFDDQPDQAQFAQKPLAAEIVLQTFGGT